MGAAYQAQDATSFALDFPGLIPEGITYQPSTDRLLISPFGIDGANYFSSAIPGAGITVNPSIARGDILVEVGTAASNGNGYPKLLGTKADPRYDNIVWAAYYNNFQRTETGLPSSARARPLLR